MRAFKRGNGSVLHAAVDGSNIDLTDTVGVWKWSVSKNDVESGAWLHFSGVTGEPGLESDLNALAASML